MTKPTDARDTCLLQPGCKDSSATATNSMDFLTPATRSPSQIFKLGLLLSLAGLSSLSAAMGLTLEPAPAHCSKAVQAPVAVPPAAAQRLTGSHATQGQRDVSWAWLGSPTDRYPHAALGSRTHAGSVHVLTVASSGVQEEVVYRLPINRVFEDLSLRLADLNQDGRDEIIVVESDALRGSSVVVLGLEDSLRGRNLRELARSPPTGSPFRWLNPVGVADFDADGKLDVAAVTTPHIGGVLTLHHYRPPQLVPYAKAMDASNHLMGSPEQQLAVIMQLPGQRPTTIVPDMSLKALHALRWEGSDAHGKFKQLADVMPLPARVQRITLLVDTPGVACILLADNTWRRVTLTKGH